MQLLGALTAKSTHLCVTLVFSAIKPHATSSSVITSSPLSELTRLKMLGEFYTMQILSFKS